MSFRALPSPAAIEYDLMLYVPLIDTFIVELKQKVVESPGFKVINAVSVNCLLLNSYATGILTAGEDP